LDGDAEPKTQ